MSNNRGAAAPRSGGAGGGRVQQTKLVLLGDQGVGKSSIALRFVRGQFPEHSEATVGGRLHFYFYQNNRKANYLNCLLLS